MRVGRSSAFARVRRRDPGGPPGAVAHSPCGEARAGTRSVGWSGAGARSPCGEALAGAVGPAQVHAPFGTLWRADRRRCTLPYGRRGAGRAVEGGPAQVHAPSREARRRYTLDRRTGAGARSLTGGARRSGRGGRTGAGAHSPRGEARNRSRCGGRTGMGARSLTGGAAPVALWWADRHGCTLPYGRRGT